MKVNLLINPCEVFKVILRALLYAVGVYVLTAVLALLVAGIIKLIYMIVHKGESKKENKKLEESPVAQ